MVEPYSSFPDANDLATIVLAGGLSTRMGRDKAFLDIDGQTLLERVITRLGGRFREILVVTSQQGRERIKEHKLEFSREVSLITDLYPGKGSLGGIYSGLALSPAFRNLVVACDMPFINARLVGHMAECAQGFDIVIARVRGFLEPLHSIYSKRCLGPMKRLLDDDNLRILDLLPEMKVRYLEEDEIAPLDPHNLSFFNINTAADFQRAQELELSSRAH